MYRAVLALALVATGALTIHAASLQQPAKLPPVRDMQKVKDNLYLISGGDTNDRSTWTGGNSLVFVTDKGVVLVDTMLPGAGASLLAKIKAVTDKPVTTVINTHTHFDHSGSNNELPASIEFVAHAGTRANMAKATCEPVTNCGAFQGENAKYLPKRTYKDRLTLFSGKDQIDLYHFGRGHTSGDSFVVFPAVRAMHAGDMYPRAQLPFVDVANSGGSALEFNTTLQGALSTIKNVDTVVGGHTPTSTTWNDFRTYTEFYRTFLSSAQDAMKRGTSVEAFIKGYAVPAAFPGFVADPVRVKANAEAIWSESKK
jgi:glyoxylase-like metal-dependent hydrolase (beta-lactamase superfamily II)